MASERSKLIRIVFKKKDSTRHGLILVQQYKHLFYFDLYKGRKFTCVTGICVTPVPVINC